MRVAQVVILVFFIHAHFLMFVFESESQSSLGEDLIQTSTLDDIPKEPGWGDPSYRGWEVLSIPGLISTYYDLDLDGDLD